MPRETAAISAISEYTIQPCTVSCQFMQSNMRMAHAFSAVICHLHFWQNDRDFLRATAILYILACLAVVWLEIFFILSTVCVYTFSAAFCTAHCALDFARDHAP